jgi:hypothetical protein
MRLGVATRLTTIHPDSVSLRPSFDHWTAKHILLFREETKAARNYMFFGWNLIGISQMALCWNGSGDLWLSQSFWVRASVLVLVPIAS